MVSHITCSKLNANETALCGGLAGLITRFVISPFDVVKIRLQVQSEPYSLKWIIRHPYHHHHHHHHHYQHPLVRRNPAPKYSGIIQPFKVIIKEEGFKALFKGNVSAEWLYVTYGAAQFYAYHHLDTYLRKQNLLNSTLQPFISGMLAGSFATAVTYPFDLLRTRFAIQGKDKVVYNGLSHAVSDIYQNEGMRGFYRGLGSSIVQIMPYMGLMFFSYESLCSMAGALQEKNIMSNDHKRVTDMLCGSIAGIVSKTGVFPIDVVRKRLQVQGPHLSEYAVSSIPNYAHQKSIFRCLNKIVQTEGFLGLYKGIVPGLLKAGPSGAVYFLMFELAKDAMTTIKDSEFHLEPVTNLLKL
ncbi:mitochondrial carrier domain-containing protein [Mycotypha africana]|uniref:mitochondrial carrier domain-containing protein n=1 Tax=Mycotypha africana TaxID=64632 RepID=UPI002301A158|nr:mitochondrial carrier domain-containing protein [Mycotypha africana]KAI8968013.1 mitochondrial carrier domain-containing protein [Mycotypha africana]